MASVAEIDGLTVPTAAEPAAAAAYSVRLLDSLLGTTYTGAAMRIRRVTGTGNTGNDDEADVAFDSGVISLDSAVSNFSAGGSNATTLGQFLNVGTVNGTAYTDADSLSPNTAAAYVDEWKDQSGNANHAEQSTPASQPQIHLGTVNTDLILENGKPVLQSLGSSSNLYNSSGLTSYDPLSVFAVSSINNRAILLSIGSTSLDGNIVIALSGNTGSGASGGGASVTTLYKDGSSWTPTRDNVYDDYLNTQRLTSAINVDLNASSGEQYNLGTAEGFWHNHNYQEFIIYPIDQDTAGNRTGIEQNINSNYLIYQPTDAPTSGLLATYTGAAAAYSVRQLSDKAILCMRIRRDMGTGNPGDDDEINIGFDSNGDLDTQAIADFCGTGTGYVTRWWDQSVNGNHANQDGQSLQPQIYNGTAVFTEGSAGNEKPIIRSTIDATLNYPLGNNPQQIFGVFKATQAQTNQAILGSSNDAYLLLMTSQGSSSELRFSRTLTRIDQSTYTGTTRAQALAAFANQVVLYCDYTTTATNGNMHFGFDQSFVMSDIQEVVIFPDTATHTVADVEDSINSYYSVY